MMKHEIHLKTLDVAARYVVIEINDGGFYNTEQEYTVLINNEPYLHTDRAVTFIGGLLPDTRYTVSVDGCESELSVCTAAETATVDVRDYGAGCKETSDVTAMLQAAVLACPEGGRVLVPEGEYRITSIFLKSNIALELEYGATLIAQENPCDFPVLPAIDDGNPVACGTWEGAPAKMYAAMINALGCENVRIYGEGMIKGSGSFDTWWHMKGYALPAARPRLLYFYRSRNISVAEISLADSPSWTVHPLCCDGAGFYSLDIKNPADSPNTDGINPESCNKVVIAGARISVGDDCVAVKAGRLTSEGDIRQPAPCTDIHIFRCLMEKGHGAVSVGSEIAGSVRGLRVDNCVFSSTDRGLRVKTRRGIGNGAVIEDIMLCEVEMDNVKTPFVVNCFYDCAPDGKSHYVQTRKAQPVDSRTPIVGEITLRDIICRRCHIAAAFFSGLPEMKIAGITMENVGISFASEPETGMPDMLGGVEPFAGRGIIAENVARFSLKNITVQGSSDDIYSFTEVDEVCME